MPIVSPVDGIVTPTLKWPAESAAGVASTVVLEHEDEPQFQSRVTVSPGA